MAQAYRHKGTGVVIVVEPGTTLEDVVTAGGQYEAASLDDVATDVPAYGPLAGGTLGRDEHDGGWVTAPGVTPQAVTAASFMRPATDGTPPPAGEQAGELEPSRAGDTELVDPAVLAAAYEVDTVEGVNGYLDDHTDQAPAVLAYEAAHANRKGIVEGRHAAATDGAEQ